MDKELKDNDLIPEGTVPEGDAPDRSKDTDGDITLEQMRNLPYRETVETSKNIFDKGAKPILIVLGIVVIIAVIYAALFGKKKEEDKSPDKDASFFVESYAEYDS